MARDVEWHGKHPSKSNMPGNTWYSRIIAGKKHTKIMLGHPKV